MTPAQETGVELRSILRVAGPMMAAQGGLMAMGVVDTLLVGRVRALDLAAVSLGAGISSLIMIFGAGMGLGAEPLVGQAFGAGEHQAARAWFWQGIWVALVLTPALGVITVLATFGFEPFGVAHDLSELASAYTYARLLSLPFHCVAAVQRAYLTNVGKPRPIVVAVIAANVVNAGADAILIFGLLGAPALGAVGAGLSSPLAMGLLVAIQGWGIRRISPSPIERPVPAKMGRIFHVGWPVGAQTTLEVGIFTLVGALIARMGAEQLGGHQVAITLASLTFMMAVGIANATTARVGFHVGRSDQPSARRAGFVGIALGGAFMAACGSVFIAVPAVLARLFSSEAEVVASAVPLIRIAGVFALSDGIQVVAIGALRGAGDTRWAFWTNLAAHWVVGLPIALSLSSRYGAAGYWWGLTTGLTLVAATLLVRFARLTSRSITRV